MNTEDAEVFGMKDGETVKVTTKAASVQIELEITDDTKIGVPAGALHFKKAAFDILLPLLIAGITLTRADIAKMGNGGLLQTSKRDGIN